MTSHDAFDTQHRLAELERENADLRERCRALEELVQQHDLLPVPPVELRVRVGGWEDPDHFLGVGRKIFWDVKRLLGMIGRAPDGAHDVLDFGCGCGRVLRHVRPTAGQRVTGCDIDPESIDWCRRNLVRDGLEFVAIRAEPPLPFDAQRFDLVIAVSVFSHLPEAMQFAWLDELHRVVAPGGALLASVHGEGLLPADTPPALRAALVQDGFLYAKGYGTPGLPEFYQTAYHRPDYVRARWQEHGFTVACELPRGINNHQDAYVLVRAS